MKQTSAFVALLILLSACGSNSSTTSTSDSTKTVDSTAIKPIQSPYDVTYSSKFAIDDPKNAEAVLNFWKAYDKGDFSGCKNFFADSFQVNLASGLQMHLNRDSTLSVLNAYRGTRSAVSSTVTAVMAVKSTDRNEHWVLIWGSEKATEKNGKTDSVGLHEAWRFNNNGQTDLMLQYTESFTPPAPMKKKK